MEKLKLKKLCVFPNDPLKVYYEKGEIKLRYFNPKNIFDEIHVISLFDSEIEEDKVKTVAGNASFKIHLVGKINLLNKNKKKNQIIDLIRKIQPDVLRSYRKASTRPKFILRSRANSRRANPICTTRPS